MLLSARKMPENSDTFGTTSQPTTLDIELLKKEIGQRFSFYDVKYNIKNAVFFCRLDEETLEEKFDDLRRVLSDKGYIPMLRYEKGEHAIYVIKKPKIKKKPIWVNILLLVATVFTTTLAGALQWVGIYEQAWAEKASFPDIIIKSLEPSYLLDGLLFFSIPILLILGIHEMGHYYASKKHNLDTSLPYFIPVPPPFILGTFGALISTREPMPNRKTLLDVGVAGPISGFLVTILVLIFGLYLMQENPIEIIPTGNEITVMYPLVVQGLSNLFTIPPDTIMHPTLFAGWVGCFITALNLLPIGQLDGGHVVKALLKDNHKYVGWAVIFAVIALSMFYTGWLLFLFIILFLIGTQHQPPLNELSPLDNKRKILGIIALVIFIICFAPIPMYV